MVSLLKFQAELGSIAKELGQGEVHLAQLGWHVRQKMPRFTPGDFGCATFTELLESCTALGRLRFGERAEDRWFVFNSGDARDSSPAHVPADDVVVKSVRIVRTVWDGCVDVDGAGAWLDLLATGHIETDPTSVEDEPERFIKLPHFDRTRQAALLLDFLEHVEGEFDPRAVAAVTEDWRATKSPYSQLLGMLKEHGLDRRWLAYLRGMVRGALQKWAGVHGVSPNDIFKRSQPSKISSERGASGGLIHSLDDLDLRAFLKSAIDAMTLAELSQWSVPVRLLLKSS